MLQIGDTFQDGGAVFKVKKFGADGALIGSVTWYAGAGTPENYLLCDGSAVSRTNYADLFAVIGTTYGAGDGSTTFALPNLIDRVVQGAATAGTYKKAGLPNIKGSIPIIVNDTSYRNADITGAFVQEFTRALGYSNASANEWNRVKFDASKSNSIYGSSTTVQPQSLTLRPLIKYI
ncbi:MAG: phage tail protein [Veillonellaceae bacterium]|nr:phage tail protein [Veillonellaceae bacterium]